MKTILTEELIKFLISKGYLYCLSNTVLLEQTDARIGIILKPLKTDLLLLRAEKSYETCYYLLKELKQMALGIADTRIFVELSFAEFAEYGIRRFARD